MESFQLKTVDKSSNAWKENIECWVWDIRTSLSDMHAMDDLHYWGYTIRDILYQGSRLDQQILRTRSLGRKNATDGGTNRQGVSSSRIQFMYVWITTKKKKINVKMKINTRRWLPILSERNWTGFGALDNLEMVEMGIIVTSSNSNFQTNSGMSRCHKNLQHWFHFIQTINWVSRIWSHVVTIASSKRFLSLVVDWFWQYI